MVDIFFPVPRAYQNKYTNTFGDSRPGYPHEGADIIVPDHTPLYAIVDFEVLFSGYSSTENINIETNGGWTIVIKALRSRGRVEENDYFLYCHMEKRSHLRKGDRGKAGDRIGWSGHSSPVGTTPHLHIAQYRDFHDPWNRGAIDIHRLLGWIKKRDLFVS